MGNVHLRTKMLVLMAGLFIAATAANLVWTNAAQNEQMENELRNKAEMLSLQMKATWNFMADNEERFESSEYSTDTKSYQGLHCAIIGRTIGMLFTSSSDYVTRYVNFNPRNIEDEPDEFESRALETFYSGQGVTEYYETTTYDGEESFRYLASMEVSDSCLKCHGEPVGELDVTGHAKEGWQKGDVGGAISIVIPTKLYTDAEQRAVVRSVTFFLGLLIALLLIAYLALSHLVTRPLTRLQDALAHVKEGDLGVSVAPSDSSIEMNSLISEFNKMSRDLAVLYNGLESQVEERTAQLRESNGLLDRQSRQLQKINGQLKEANEQLANENQYKSEFLSMISHELRTPLTSIIAFSEMLNRRNDRFDSEEAEICREIEANSRVLLLMINDILEMSRVEAGRAQLDVGAVDMGDLVGLVQSVMKPVARQNGVDFTCKVERGIPVIAADFEKLRHILENLAGNAMKFTPEGGSVHLHVGYDEGASEVVFEVIDTGIGIAEKDVDRIFEKFVQADSSASRKFNGTGLGLPLAREYAELHGGSLTVKSVVGEGSTFIVRIPAHRAEGEA